MAKERKKREKRKSSVDLSRAIKLGTEYSSEGARRYGLGKKIHKESEDLQGEISREQEKAEHKRLWSSVGLALGSLAAGIATGGANWYVQAAAVATGAIGGGVIGREASEFTKGEMKDIKSKDYLFYRKEAEKQKDAYAGFDKELRDSILSRGLAAGALAGAVAGGGEILSKMKTAEMTKAAQAAEIAKAQKSAAVISDPSFAISPVSASQPKAAWHAKASIPVTDSVSTVAAPYQGRHLIQPPMETTYELAGKTFADAPELIEGASLAKYRNLPTSKSLADLGKVSLTPMTDAAAPTIMDSFFQGLDTMKSESTRKSILLGGGYQIAGHRPELSTLRNVQFQSPMRSTYST